MVNFKKILKFLIFKDNFLYFSSDRIQSDSEWEFNPYSQNPNYSVEISSNCLEILLSNWNNEII